MGVMVIVLLRDVDTANSRATQPAHSAAEGPSVFGEKAKTMDDST